MGRFAEPQEMAPAVGLLASDEAGYIAGGAPVRLANDAPGRRQAFSSGNWIGRSWPGVPFGVLAFGGRLSVSR